MAFTNQVFTAGLPELNPVGPGSAYTATTFIDHLTAWFTANTSGWTVSASGANYLELKPPVTAINVNDRILFWGGAALNAAALGLGATSTTTAIYCCMAPNAGTTGPDNLPSVGNPYTGVISSKMTYASITPTTYKQLQVFQSNDVIKISHGVNDVATDIWLSVCMAGRFFNPAGTADQLPAVAGLGDVAAGQWSEAALTSASGEWNTDANPGASDTCVTVQETAGDVAWTQCRRTNNWKSRAYRQADLKSANLFKIDLHRTTGDPNESDVLIGWPLFALGGPAELNGRQIADSGTDLGYAFSHSGVNRIYSTWYLMNEALA